MAIFGSLVYSQELTTVMYNMNTNQLTLHFNQQIQTDLSDLNLVSIQDGSDTVLLTNAVIITENNLTNDLEITLLYGDVIDLLVNHDDSNYNWQSFKYWGMSKDLVNAVESLNISQLSLSFTEGAFIDDSGSAVVPGYPENIVILNQDDNAPEPLSVSYIDAANQLQISFDRQVQFDQIAEDRTCDYGQGDCPGNGILDGGPPEDGDDPVHNLVFGNNNGVLDMEPNIDVSKIGLTGAGGTIWLQSYNQILETEDDDEINIVLGWQQAALLEALYLEGNLDIILMQGAFYDTNYNPNLLLNLALNYVPDPQPLVLTDAVYFPGLNELDLSFINSRDVVHTEPAPAYTNVSLAVGEESFSLSGIKSVTSNSPGIQLTELLLTDQSALELMILAMAPQDELLLSIQANSIYDVLGNGNWEVLDFPVTISGDFDNPELAQASYDAESNTIELNWEPHRISYFQDIILLTQPQPIDFSGITITDIDYLQNISPSYFSIYRDYSRENVYLQLSDADGAWIQSLGSISQGFDITLQGYEFFSSGNTNNNGNLPLTTGMLYNVDATGPVLLSARIDAEDQQLQLEFDDLINLGVLDLNIVMFNMNGEDYALEDLILLTTQDYSSMVKFQIDADSFNILTENLPQNQLLDMNIYLPTEAFQNIDAVQGLAFLDLNDNGYWDENEPDSIPLLLGRFLYTENYQSFPLPLKLRFCSQKYEGENHIILVEENVFVGYCKNEEDDLVYEGIHTEIDCYNLPDNSANTPAWVQFGQEDVLEISSFITENLAQLEQIHGDLIDLDGNGKITFVFFDILDEYSKGANNTSSYLFTHGYFSLNAENEGLVNVGDFVYLDTSPQELNSENCPYSGLCSLQQALIHETTKLLISQNDPDEEDWLKEGLAFMGQKRILDDVKFFGRNTNVEVVPNNSLTYISFSSRYRYDQYNIYGFLNYLFEKYSLSDGWDIINSIASNVSDQGITAVNAGLGSLGFSETAADVFLNYATACYLDIPHEISFYNGLYSIDSEDYYGTPASKRNSLWPFEENYPPPYEVSGIAPWAYKYYLIDGYSVSWVDNGITFNSPLLSASDNLNIAAAADLSYKTNKLILKNGWQQTMDPLYEIVAMELDPGSNYGSLPVSTNSIPVDADVGQLHPGEYVGSCSDPGYDNENDCETAGAQWTWFYNFEFRSVYGICSTGDYDNQQDCESAGGDWDWFGNPLMILVVAQVEEQPGPVEDFDFIMSNSPIQGPAPENLHLAYQQEAVLLDWDPPIETGLFELESYRLLRKTDGDQDFQILMDNITENSFLDQTISLDEIYSYAVLSFFTDGSFSDTSNVVIADHTLYNFENIGYRNVVTNYGSIGDPDFEATGRTSCEFPAGTHNNYLYDGGLWIGATLSGEPSVSTYFYNSSDKEWRPCRMGSFVRPEFEFLQLDQNQMNQNICFDDLDSEDIGGDPSLGLQVYTEVDLYPSLLNTETGELIQSPWGRLRYSIYNTGLNGNLEDVVVGLWLDFDVSSLDETSKHIDDLVDYDEALKLSFMYDGDDPTSPEDDSGENGLSNGYVGIALLDSPDNAVASHAWWNWESDPGGDDERWLFMTAEHPAMEGYQYYPNPLDLGYPPFDYRILQTTGPFYLASYDTLHVDYLLVFGENGEAIRENVIAAKIEYGYDSFAQGDVNMDHDVDILDIVMIISFIMEYAVPTSYQLELGDVNSDGAMDVLDIVTIVTMILGGDAGRVSQVTLASIQNTGTGISLSADGDIAGLQLELSGDFEIDKSSLPEGWEFYANSHRILMYSYEPRSLADGELFIYEGDLKINAVIVSDWSGNRVPVQVDLVPQSYKLGLPFPNPFNNFTTLSYDLPADGVMSLIVYDITGREIQRLVDSGFQNAGNYSMVWKAEEVSSGLYFIRMESGDFNFTRKVVLLK